MIFFDFATLIYPTKRRYRVVGFSKQNDQNGPKNFLLASQNDSYTGVLCRAQNLPENMNFFEKVSDRLTKRRRSEKCLKQK